MQATAWGANGQWNERTGYGEGVSPAALLAADHRGTGGETRSWKISRSPSRMTSTTTTTGWRTRASSRATTVTCTQVIEESVLSEETGRYEGVHLGTSRSTTTRGERAVSSDAIANVERRADLRGE